MISQHGGQDVELVRRDLSPWGRVTQPRLASLRVLREADRHLTQQQILDLVRAELPSVKPSTVYRTMASFLDQGLAHRVEGVHGSRYGAGPWHAHALCVDCEEVWDLPDLDEDTITALRASAGSAEVLGLTLQARCTECCRVER